MMRSRWKGFAGSGLIAVGLFVAGGCEASCRSDAGNEAEDVVDEIGDEVEDVVDELKEDDHG